MNIVRSKYKEEGKEGNSIEILPGWVFTPSVLQILPVPESVPVCHAGANREFRTGLKLV